MLGLMQVLSEHGTLCMCCLQNYYNSRYYALSIIKKTRSEFRWSAKGSCFSYSLLFLIVFLAVSEAVILRTLSCQEAWEMVKLITLLMLVKVVFNG